MTDAELIAEALERSANYARDFETAGERLSLEALCLFMAVHVRHLIKERAQ